jgi:hypothetical protein
MPQNTSPKVQIHAHVKPEILEQLRNTALKNNRSLAGELRQAVYNHVKAETASEGATHAAAR